ncbi:MAG: OmpP1/FadL family transporter [Betaproteobacteria bacterium]
MRAIDRVRLFPLATAAVLCALTAASPVFAQGYGLYEQGSCQMGRAGAGVANPCDDGSAMFFNPAGLALETGAVASGGVTGVAPRGTFTNDTTGLVATVRHRTFPAPSAYVAVPVGSRLVAGVGLFAPYGLTMDWPSTSEGRFLSYYSSIRSMYVQPTVAYRLTDQVMVGGGIDITHTSLELRRRVDLSTLALTGTPLTFRQIGVPPGTDFADVDLTGSGTHAGAHFGILVKANEKLSFGARYLTRQHVSIGNGRLATQQIATNQVLRVPLPGLPPGTPLDRIVQGSFASGGPLSAQNATTAIPLPDQLVLGAAVRPTPKLTLLADYQYTHWKLFDTIGIVNQFAPPTVLVESYRDSHGIRLGAEYGLSRAIVRGGFEANSAAAPDQSVTPVLPEAPRLEYAAGLGLPFGNARLDLAYMYVDQQDRQGRSTDGGLANPTVAVNNGLFKYSANLFSASIVVHW